MFLYSGFGSTLVQVVFVFLDFDALGKQLGCASCGFPPFFPRLIRFSLSVLSLYPTLYRDGSTQARESFPSFPQRGAPRCSSC